MPLTRVSFGIALVAIAACGNDPVFYQPPIRESTPSAGAHRAIYPARQTHEITGDLERSYDLETPIDVYEIAGDAVPPGTRFLSVSVSVDQPAVVGETGLLWSFSMLPGTYDGPGTYELDANEAPDLAEQSSLRADAYFQIVGIEAGDTGFAKYNVIHEPCTITFVADAIRGSLECPSLGLESDPSRTIAWTWTWERLADGE